MTFTHQGPSRADVLAVKVTLLWAGLSLGVAFLATPAKFLASTLSLPVALDVGQQTFKVYNSTEFGFLLLVVALGVGVGRRPAWAWRLCVPAVILGLQAFWLIPALDERVAMIQAGGSPPPSSLHAIYIAVEVMKILWLLPLGLMADRVSLPRRFSGH